MRRHAGTRLVAWLLAAAAVVVPIGCDDSTAQPPVAAAPVVDPRFATAEALLESFNSTMTASPYIDFDAVFSMMYAETPVQEQLLRIYRSSEPLIDLDEACWEAFGAGFQPSSKEPPRTPARARAVMTESSADRAKASHRENDGDVIDIYLVRVGNRWWVSGYTFEYDSDYDLPNIDLDKMERGISLIATAAPSVTADIRSGRWSGAGQAGLQLARLALLGYLQRDHGLNPANAAELLDWRKKD